MINGISNALLAKVFHRLLCIKMQMNTDKPKKKKSGQGQASEPWEVGVHISLRQGVKKELK